MQTIETLSNRLTHAIKQRFPDCYLHTKVSTLGSAKTPSLVVSFALGSGPDKWSNAIIHNDPGHTVFLVHSKAGLDGSIYDLSLDGGIYGYHSKVKYDKCGWQDIRVHSTEDKVVRQVERYFDKLKDAVNCG